MRTRTPTHAGSEALNVAINYPVLRKSSGNAWLRRNTRTLKPIRLDEHTSVTLKVHCPIWSSVGSRIGVRKVNKLTNSEVLSCGNLVSVALIYGFAMNGVLNGRIVFAIQFVVIPGLLLATALCSLREFAEPRTRLQSMVALVLSLPVAFLYSVWHGWISP